MHSLKQLIIVALVTTAFTGCALFRVEIQQGNFISQEQLQQLETGMSKREVRYIMGTPLIVDPFHEKSRWDYVYSYSPDLGTDFERRRVTLYFSGDELERIERDLDGSELADASEETGGTRVTAPTEASEKGFFKRTLDKVFGRDE